jgi:hypothetical protein
VTERINCFLSLFLRSLLGMNSVLLRNHISLLFEGVPASLRPRLRSAGGAKRRISDKLSLVIIFIMTGEVREVTKSQLAVALARGVSVSAWAKAHNVPRSTVYRWASEPEVRKEIAACRHRMVDRAVGQMAKRACRAVAGIGALADGAESESVRLRALRAILSDMMAFSRFGVLEERMTEIEEQLNERAGDTGHAG